VFQCYSLTILWWYSFVHTPSGFIRGPGEGAKPLAFAFHDKFKQGPLLSVVRFLWIPHTRLDNHGLGFPTCFVHVCFRCTCSAGAVAGAVHIHWYFIPINYNVSSFISTPAGLISIYCTYPLILHQQWGYIGYKHLLSWRTTVHWNAYVSIFSFFGFQIWPTLRAMSSLSWSVLAATCSW
jgi:hypothetical protein